MANEMYTINVNNFYTLTKKCFFFVFVYLSTVEAEFTILAVYSAYFSFQTDRRTKTGQNVYWMTLWTITVLKIEFSTWNIGNSRFLKLCTNNVDNDGQVYTYLWPAVFWRVYRSIDKTSWLYVYDKINHSMSEDLNICGIFKKENLNFLW